MRPITDRSALDAVERELRRLGFWRACVSSSGSRYLRLGRAPWKVRLADHPIPAGALARHCEVVHEVVRPALADAAEAPLAALDIAVRFAAMARLRLRDTGQAERRIA